MAEVVSKRPERPRRHMKITLKSGLCQGPKEGGQEGKGRRAHRLAHPDGHLPSCWLAPGLSRVTFPKDFLRWREQSLNEERAPGTQQGINSPQEAPPARAKEAVPCKDVTVNPLRPKGDRGMGVRTHIPRPMSESGGFSPGSTANLWVTLGKLYSLSGSVSPYIRWENICIYDGKRVTNTLPMPDTKSPQGHIHF